MKHDSLIDLIELELVVNFFMCTCLPVMADYPLQAECQGPLAMFLFQNFNFKTATILYLCILFSLEP